MAREMADAAKAGPISYFLFNWLNPIIALGSRRPLEVSDLGPIGTADHGLRNLAEVRAGMARRLARGQSHYSALLWSLLALDSRNVFFGGVAMLVATLLGFVGPLALSGIVHFVSAHAAGGEDVKIGAIERGYLWLIAVGLALPLQGVIMQHHHYCMARMGVRTRSAAAMLVYSKSLTIDAGAFQAFGRGRVQNMQSVDTQMIMMFPWFLHMGWISPIQIAIAVAMLYQQLGAACFVGLASLVVMAPIQSWLTTCASRFTKQINTAGDRRLRLINEIVSGIRVIKFFAFEGQMAGRVQAVRRDELHSQLKSRVVNALSSALMQSGPLIVALLTFVTFGLTSGTEMTADRAFSSIVLFGILRVPLVAMPMLITNSVQAHASIVRISDFLSQPDQKDFRAGSAAAASGPAAGAAASDSAPLEPLADGAIFFSGATLAWPKPPAKALPAATGAPPAPGSGGAAAATAAAATAPTPAVWNAPSTPASDAPPASEFRLQGIDARMPAGALTVIVGAVGAGKSALLQAIAGQMHLLSGSVTIAAAAAPAGADASVAVSPPPASVRMRTSSSSSSSSSAAVSSAATAGMFAFSRHMVTAYSSQQAWIMNASVRANVLFGEPYDEARYREVLTACSLEADLATFAAGDSTEIGESGITISGGQRARISLARCMYSSCRIILLDDVLSAVDPHVGQHMLEKAICGPLAAGRTIVMATHQLQCIPRASHVIVMDGGRIVQQGNPLALMAAAQSAGPDEDASPLGKLLAARSRVAEALSASASAPEPAGVASTGGAATADAPAAAVPSSTAEPAAVAAEATSPSATLAAAAPPAVTASSASAKSEPETSPAAAAATPALPPSTGSPASGSGSVGDAAKADTSVAVKAAAAPGKPSGKVTVAEDRYKGSVPLRVYASYMSHYGWVYAALIIITVVASTVGTVGTDFWLAHWSAGSTQGAHSTAYFVGYYAFIAAGTIIVGFVQSVAWALGSVVASQTMHDEMLKRVVRCPTSYFDSTPVGRILSRFSSDIQTIDVKLPEKFASALQGLLRVMASLIAQAVLLPYTIIASVVTMAMFVAVQRYYTPTSRELRRLESISRSPVYAHMSETLAGLPTLIAFGRHETFLSEASRKLDVNTQTLLYLIATNRWCGARFDTLGAGLVVVVALIATVSDSMSAGVAGLALSFALNVTSALNMVVRDATETETLLTSVERVRHFANLPVERPPVIADHRPPPGWPHQGVVAFEDVSVRYRADLPPALDRVSFTVKGRVGVVGRTGSGKSTTMLTLFRMLELHGGKIVIDGIDISTIGLDDLRQRLAIIPQDPVLFSGTLRYNLDPSGTATDQQLWDALAAVSMDDFVRGQGLQQAMLRRISSNDASNVRSYAPAGGAAAATGTGEAAGAAAASGLDMRIAENGSNLSVGQRQLLCMARAMLRGAKVLVCDESTASVDVASDAIIQERLRSMAGVTQLIIAHRIDTVLGCDHILVFDSGHLVEQGSPQELLGTPGSRFGGLVASSVAAHAQGMA